MSTLRDVLAAQLARYDEDAFVALGNRGLLRRATKDLEKAPASIVEETAEALVMAFGGHRIRFDARGPAQATCSCPAGGVCQHILAAALTLQREVQAAPPLATVAADPLAALHDALAAISTADMQRHAGKAGYRWAWQFVQDLEPGHGLQESGDRNLVLAFARPRVAFRFMGGGIDALVADAALSQANKYRVAALLAWRHQRGLAIAPPEPTGHPAGANLDLGVDHAPAEGGGDLADSRARLREAAQELIAECVSLGLSHLSPGIHERFSTLAVWAQGAQYPRLSALLRRAADHVELLLDRAGGADEHRLFDELTIACGLLHALGAAAARGAAPARLVGRARTRYEGAAALEVIGLGANAWRSATGFLGLTMLLWSAADQAFLSCTDARPESLRGFDPRARYTSGGPWTGLGTPRSATGRRLRLSGAQINHQGRLSTAESTSAIVLPAEPAAALRASLPAVESWAELAERRGQARGSLLGDAEPLRDWAVLAPTRFGVARFDAARQVLIWPLHDADGRVLNAELAWSPQARHAISRIEGLAPLPAGTRVVARVLPASDDPQAALVAEPLSLIHVDEPVVDALFFDPPRAADATSMAAPSQRPATPPPAVAETAPALPRVLLELRQWLRAQAERGIGDGRQAAVTLALNDRLRRCAEAGFTPFLAANDTPATASALLRANYLCLQVERLSDGAAIDPA